MKNYYLLLLLVLFGNIKTKAQYSKLYDFLGGTNLKNPSSSLVLNGNVLYGTTDQGGTYGYGGIFKINTDGTGFTSLHDLNLSLGAYPRGLMLSGNVLYGTSPNDGDNSQGCIFKINTDGTGFGKLVDFDIDVNGATPYGNLILSGSVLYGATSYGASSSFGSIFKVNTDGTGFTTIYDFTNSSNGSRPMGPLILSGSVLYGATLEGGTNGYGCLFKINVDGTGYSKLHDFNITTESSPSPLVLSGTELFGSAAGGSLGVGCIFKINTSGAGYSKLFDFSTITGADGPGYLTVANNYLYGFANGGVNNNGVIFKIKTDGTGYSKLFDFKCSTSGCDPIGSLTPSSNGFYGLTINGGANDLGVIFKYAAPLSIEDFERNEPMALRVYPNPIITTIENSLSLKFPDLQKETPVLIELRNILGEKYYSKTIMTDTQGSGTLPIEDSQCFAKGIYMISALYNNKLLSNKIVVE
ncbi:MAG: hypothetical protein HYU69_08130 [Bacteroidetes bacterium]|nr:hypothetical protein [Bacteroidota bacterium]